MSDKQLLDKVGAGQVDSLASLFGLAKEVAQRIFDFYAEDMARYAGLAASGDKVAYEHVQDLKAQIVASLAEEGIDLESSGADKLEGWIITGLNIIKVFLL